ncbi:SDR family NAD(P)-dependent oxidoreductase [Paenibacillus tyrfis]|uniref:SDR family NAD(P)-dependent oxidoreductase n=1 Tax=Paenibacillus tyrfis TaxID=1501230 RepID=UPI000B59468A|nr:SDR family NAD(P)-dependent oxidoreductase [Paenibacillus tyrfis]
MEDQILIGKDHPVVKHHKAYGQELFPGFAYIDLLYQLFRERGYDFARLDLLNLSIYNPLVVGQDLNVLLRVQCDETEAGRWQIRVEGQEQRKGVLSPERKLHITAEMHLCDPLTFDEVLDISRIKQTAARSVSLDSFYAQCRHQELVHTGFMLADGVVYEGENGASYIEIALGDEARRSAEGFMFHPTLIDGSGVGTGVLFDNTNEEEQRLFLPLFYEKFRAAALLGTECWTRIAKPVERKKELNFLTMEFFDTNGKKIAELLNYKGKLVRGAGLINPARKAEAAVQEKPKPKPQPRPSVPVAPPAYASGGGSAVEEASAFLRRLIAEKLGKPEDQVATDVGYYEIGLDSSMLLEVVTAIGSKLETQLMPTLLFEYTTITELAEYLAEHHADRFGGGASGANQAEAEWSEPADELYEAERELPETGSYGVPDAGEDIAIIGMSGKYPQSRDLHEFWENLLAGKDCITEVPESRWEWERLEGVKSPSGKPMSRWGGFIHDPDRFDPQFFRISPREAETIDPQERLFLETCWEAVEDAGYTPKTVVTPKGPNKRRNVGVFVGVMHKDYTLIQAEAVRDGRPQPLSLSYASIANRVSYFCNFHGPSMAIDTVCSSSLIAVHLALESIKRGECEVALAGGVNLSLHPNKYMTYGMMDMHSSDGYCHTFGKGGDGYVSGEGIGAVLLKPLSKAIADNDHIYAVVKGSTTNHVGAVSGITVPSPVAQADMIQACLEKTGVDPRTISYMEAHGTGTSLGDPIEIQGLVKAFRHFTPDKQYCSIGSVKSNIGHGESAAGISGLHKVALQLHHKKLVPSLHSVELNPYIDLENSPFYVQHKTEEWQRPTLIENGERVEYPRRAGLSSFGAYGSNAHVILEEYIPPQVVTSTEGQGAALVPLSAKNKERLVAYAGRLLAALNKNEEAQRQNPVRVAVQAVEPVQAQGMELRLEAVMREMLAELIHVKADALEADVEWSEYGIEPIHLAQLSERLQAEFQLEVDPKELLEQESIAAAVAHVAGLEGAVRETAAAGLHLEPVTPAAEALQRLNLIDLAYTLQVGREAMEERVAFVVRDLSELKQKLEAYLADPGVQAGVHRGSVKQNKETVALFSADEDSRELLNRWIAKGKHDKLADLWVKGVEIDWNRLYRQGRPQRISLPTYPFAKEHYWVPKAANRATAQAAAETAGVQSVLHPLLHQNTSDFAEQRFSSTFTGEEFFLNDHRVQGNRVLPGVAYLEMARAAVEHAAGGLVEGPSEVQLQNVAWVRPITVGEQPVQVHIGLFPEENGEVAYEIYTVGQDSEPVVHGEGRALLASITAPPTVDLASFQKQASSQVLTSAACYEAFSSMGIEYGEGHRGIQELYVGAGLVLARLSLPSALSASASRYVLHPSLMDSALQASVGFLLGARGDLSPNPILPFVLQKLEVYQACTSEMWAVLRHSEGSQAGGAVEKLDIDLCDEAGRVSVRIKRFTYRALDAKTPSGQEGKNDPLVGNLTLAPVWDVVTPERVPSFPASADRVLVVGGTSEQQRSVRLHLSNVQSLDLQPSDSIAEIGDKLQRLGSFDHIFWIAPERTLSSVTNEALVREQEEGVLLLFRTVKALLQAGYESRPLGWTVLTMQAQPLHAQEQVNPTHASLHGLVGSLAKEYPRWKIRLVDLEAGAWPLVDLLQLPTDRRGRSWVYRGGEWHRQQLVLLQTAPADGTLYRQGGVYVVIGGAGRIGEAWTEYMIRRYEAQVVWIGRRQPDASIRAKLEALGRHGKAPHYVAADATDAASLQRARDEIKQRYGRIDGIIHSAMVLQDAGLDRMEEAQFRTGFSAKADVSLRVAQVFRDEPLDFVLFFSSIISFIKNANQSHYAAGCTFMDAFAHQMAREMSCRVKVMNWGYWNAEEIVHSKEGELLSQVGIGFVEPKEAMEALETLLTRPIAQFGLMKTTKAVQVEGVNATETMQIGTDVLPALAESLQKRLPDQNGRVARMKADESLDKTDMEELLVRLLGAQLQAPQLQDGNAVRGFYRKWLAESVAVLERDPALKFDTPAQVLWQEWEANKPHWLTNPNLKAQVQLVEATLRALPDILTGRVPATEIMFPNSSMALVEGIYKNNQISDYFNEVLADTVVTYLQERMANDPAVSLRILEIGAGTGGTSAMVFRKLRPYQDRIVEYCYTDISRAFLLHAEREYGADNPYLAPKIFNVEAPLAGQDIEAGAYDLVIATNVLHATKNIRQTIRNAKAVLRPNGLLLLNEISQNALFTHLTFGLLEGWWLYEDAELRIPGNPGLFPEVWGKVLASEGFSGVFHPAEQAHEFGQQVVVAMSDGVVRQKQAAKKSKPVAKQATKPQAAKPQAVSIKPAPVQATVAALSPESLREKSVTYLKELVSDTLKIPVHKIDETEALEEYGIDSILVVQLTNALREVFGEISSTLFFEYQTLGELADYFVKAHKDALQKAIGFEPEPVRAEPIAVVKPASVAPVAQAPVTKAPVTKERLRENVIAYLQNVVGDTLKIPSDQIDPSESLEEYGIDSILVVQLTNALREGIGEDLNSTLFFEYQTLDSLADHLVDTQREALVAKLGLAGQTEVQQTPRTEASVPAQAAQTRTNLTFRTSSKRYLQRQEEAPVAREVRAEEPPMRLQDIAIVGLAGRYPGADDVNSFWNNLKQGRSSVGEIPQERWNWQDYFDPEKGKAGTMYTRWGAFLKDIDKFDPLFFQISPAEAEKMDPQERLFLETVYASIEDAGYTTGTLAESGKVGVFAGIMNAFYPTGANFWSLANRVSYLFNFQGPSINVDTACSSSLTAIHLALESLYSGTSDCAIAGGVNLISDPAHYLRLSAMTMLSATDACKAFGDGADGFVDGEGVGAILLKPLHKAIADGDHIYGVIKGSMVNAGGKTNGYTVPNPNAQSRVIADALQRAGVHPRTVSYLEAHGTGTSLGDPIEITGLTKAFEKGTEDKQFCAIGSAKSNIGHCESASGIAGVTKVLLQMMHGQIAPTLHAKTLNPNINFGKTPFVVQQELGEWPRPVLELDGVRREYPRIAGISSFGAGGSNAHLVIEEYIPSGARQTKGTAPEQPVIVVLSAKNEERLQEKSRQLLAFVAEGRITDADLVDTAYTLQVGREKMEERMALVVRSLQELTDRLEAYVQGQENIAGLYRGQVRRGKDKPSLGHLVSEASDLMQNRQHDKLAEFWVLGGSIDWNELYQTLPQRISLPTYPFSKERYWMSKEEGTAGSGRRSSHAMNTALHPLLHRNTSDLTEQRFTSTFTGEEFFLADHVVQGQRMLPGVAYLEMAREAVELAAASLKDGRDGLRLKHVIWASPLLLGEQPLDVHLSLFPEADGEIGFEVYREEEAGQEPVIHSQGRAVWKSFEAMPSLDLKTLQSQCSLKTLDASAFYSMFESLGIDHGPAHRGVERVHLGTDRALARLVLPASVEQESSFVLHPSLMDSALQVTLALLSDGADIKRPALPFALEEVDILGSCTDEMWVLVRRSAGSRPGDKVQKFDLDLCAAEGDVRVRIKGYSARQLDDGRGREGTLMLLPNWKEQPVGEPAQQPSYSQRLVLLCDMEADVHDARCITLRSETSDPAARYEAHATQAFREIKALLQQKPKGQVLVQIAVGTEPEHRLSAGLSALLRTASQENPNLIGQLIELERTSDATEVAARLQENLARLEDRHVRYQDGKRWVAGWSEAEVSRQEVHIPWKDGGTYLITGGAGGLGLIVAREIVQQVSGTTLYLTGRSALGAAQQTAMQELQATGARIEYKRVDVTDRAQVARLFDAIRADSGKLDGLVHSAGVIRDNFMLKKTEAELAEVLAPKVAGLVNLDQASGDMPLDFFVTFSSIAGVLGNPGQADYSMANAFLDAYAQYRNGQVAAKQHQGRTLSINWPLWQDGGMRLDAETERTLQEQLGMTAMPTLSGVQALYQSLAVEQDQVVVFHGDMRQLRASLLEQPQETAVPTASASVLSTSSVSEEILRDKSILFFKKLLSTVLKMPTARIEADAPLEDYGIDSIMVMQMTNQLEKTFGSLPKTLFFEYQNIEDLTGYFIDSYPEPMKKLLGVEVPTDQPAPAVSEPVAAAEPIAEREAPVLSKRGRGRFVQAPSKVRANVPTVEATSDAKPLDIAIIGVSGRYPEAQNLREFWKNVRDGRDSITEIPADRWDHSPYYDADKRKPGKTNSKWGGFLQDVDKFDPLFFNISPRDAEFMDPQERLFLQTVYEAMEDAGYTRDALAKHRAYGLDGNVGVFVGVMYEEYQLYGAQQTLLGKPMALAGNPSSIANRVSYFLNLHGPSLAVDTMCSSSLTAIHLACQSLLHGGCEVAIAGGVNVSVHPNKYLLLGQNNFASSKGRCESFGEGGDGYVPGEGVGAVLLKPLAKALEDGDQIYGVLKATAINHGGKTNGYTVPNPNAQASVVGRAFKEAGIDPGTLSYVEAHGTGTSLGDPIEIAGLTKVFQESRVGGQKCAIGSVKSNIGHSESAAGIAGLTKVLLQMKHRQLVPSLHSAVLNPHIDFDRTPFVVQQELAEWKRPVIDGREVPRRATVSSFGAGGSNACLLLEEYVPEAEVRVQRKVTAENPAVVVLSAKEEPRLIEQARHLLTVLQEEAFTEADLVDLAYTLQVGREAMEERLALTASSVGELVEKLAGFLNGEDGIDGLYRGQLKGNKETLSLFAADEDLQAAIEAWVSKRKYAKLLDLWVKGLAFDWSRLYEGNRPRRISLPTYPFAKQRCWVEPLMENPGVASFAPQTSSAEANLLHDEQGEVVSLVPVWDAVPLERGPLHPSPLDQIAIVGGTPEQQQAIRQYLPNARELDIKPGESVEAIASKLQARGALDHIFWIAPDRSSDGLELEAVIAGQHEGVLLAFRLIKAVLDLGYGAQSLGWTVLTTQTQALHREEAVNPVHAGLHGLIGSMAKEYPNWNIRLVDLDAEEAWPLPDLFTIPADPQGDAWVYRGRQWHRQQLAELSCPQPDQTIYKPGGVYVVIGGAGGIGEVWSEYMIRTYAAQIVWIGRRSQDAAIEAKRIALSKLGPAPHYIAADATDRQSLERAYEEIKARYVQVDGIVHSAIVLADSSLANMEEGQFRASLAAKVDVSVRMAQVFGEEPLDFVMIFSSVNAFLKAAGQSNYVAGCTFTDAFAHRLAQEWPCAVKVMNWGYWGSVGVVASPAYQERMTQAGIGSIKPPEGMQALEALLEGPMDQMALMKILN